jgi:hypothetical protein
MSRNTDQSQREQKHCMVPKPDVSFSSERWPLSAPLIAKYIDHENMNTSSCVLSSKCTCLLDKHKNSLMSTNGAQYMRLAM